jgi:adenosylcobinamide-GDP ribazoletransferase
VKYFFIALQFLTIIPIKIKQELKPKDISKSLRFFPVIGLLIGLLLAGVCFVFNFLPPLVMSALIISVLVLISGGLHLDGFADSCDGLYGIRPKEERLKIMRASDVGAMGAIGIACLLILKFAVLASIPKDMLFKTLIIMPVFSRWTQVLACYTSEYAREQGKGMSFLTYNSKKEFIIASIFTLVLFVLILKFKGIILFGLSCVPVFVFMFYIKKKIQGMTGDTVGAVNEFAEVSYVFNTLLLYC